MGTLKNVGISSFKIWEIIPTNVVSLKLGFIPRSKLLGKVLRLSGRMPDLMFRDCLFEPQQRHCVVSLSETLFSAKYWFNPKKHSDMQKNLS